jgi:hypothetical protein
MIALARDLLIGATLLGGLLAGGNLDRALVANPAWRRTGAEAWAAFSRNADLGNGLILYPAEAIGAAVLTLAAAISFQVGAAGTASAGLLLWTAVVLSLGGLLLTAKAAPIMLGLRQGTDAASTQRAFENFSFWGNLRAACQILCFPVQVFALAALSFSPSQAGS